MLWSRKTWSSGSVTSIYFIISDSKYKRLLHFKCLLCKICSISETKWSAYRIEGTVYECGAVYSRKRYHTGV